MKRRASAAVLTTIGLVVGIVAVLGSPGGTASAHAVVEEIVPADGQTVDRSPDEVTLRFSEHVSLTGGNARVLDDAGDVVADAATVVDTTVSISLPDDLDDGTYVVAWRVISADSHPIGGTSVFHVGAPSANAADVRAGVERETSADASTLVRFLTIVAVAVAYGSALIAAGLWWFARFIARCSDDVLVGARCRLLIVIASAAGLLAALVSLPLRIARLGGGWSALSDGDFARDTITGPTGAAIIVSMVGLALVLAGRWTAVAAVGTVLGVGGYVLEGHTRSQQPEWLMWCFDVVHLAATAGWLGGLVGVFVVLRSRTDVQRAASAVARFSGLAAVLIAAMAAAGVGMSLIVLPSLAALWETGWGLALIVKVALVAAALLLGTANRRRVRAMQHGGGSSAVTDAGRAALSKAVRVELVVLVAVVVATAVLVNRSPTAASTSGSSTPTTDSTAPESSGPVGVEVELSQNAGAAAIAVSPATVGSNDVIVELTAPDGSPLSPLEIPTVELRERSQDLGPLRPTVHDMGGISYHVPVDIPVAGRWELVVRVRVDDFTSATATTTFDVSE